jgi:glycosyltransferase involved in cell wall biosynthesis
VSENIVYLVVIAFNSEKTIKSTLASIARQRIQPPYSLTVIVIDDGSTDSTRYLASSSLNEFNLRGKVESTIVNRGRGHARNLGVALSRESKFIGFVDSDIVLSDDWVSRCLNALLQVPTRQGVGGVAIPDGDIEWISRKYALALKVTNHTDVLTGSNSLFRTELFEHINFRIENREGEDILLLRDARSRGFKDFYRINELIVKHQGSKTFCGFIIWMLRSGIGATKIGNWFHPRLPDLAFLFLFLSTLLAIALLLTTKVYFISLVPFILLIGASQLHLIKKFNFFHSDKKAWVRALFVNAIFLGFYMLGRLFGILDIKSWTKSA